MNTKPFLHKHYLLYDDTYELLDERCNQCNEQIKDYAFNCERCNFWLHRDCAYRQLPLEISDPLNSERTLRLEFYCTHFMCCKCFRLSKGYGYCSSDRSFKLDVVCASSSTNWEVEEMDKDVAGKPSWYRFRYGYPLTLVKYRKVGRYEYTCSWCHQSLSNTLMFYIYLDDYAYERLICLHETCLSKIPNKINFHPFHPYHPLYIQIMNSYDRIDCIACGLRVVESAIYYCGKCCFYIHILCSNLKPTLKHYTSHHHPLTYIRVGDFVCNVDCKSFHDRRGAFYRCVECDFNVHVACLIPSSVEHHKYHRHSSLALVRFFIEEGSSEQYCDICEQRRDPQNHVYYCKECKFTAHIECALNMVNDTRFDYGTTSVLMHEEAQQNPLGTNCQMEHPFHPHPLNLKRLIEIPEYRKLNCMACRWEICEEEDDDEQVYVCTQESSCRARDCYVCHKTCAEMPIDFNLIHIHHHPLTLIKGSYKVLFMCDRCRYVSNGFKYECFQCSFKLDIKCAADLIASKTQNQVVIGKYDQQQTKLSHFIHHHELHLGYVRFNIYKEIGMHCRVCWLSISGPVYICFLCNCYVHQSCPLKLPSHIEIPFHPKHTLYPYTRTLLGKQLCRACTFSIYDFGYGCCQCNIYFHYVCTTSLRRSLTSNFHPHNLYLFHRFRCARCHECRKPLESWYYHCSECDIAFHLRCMQVPDKVKCKHHIHNLILKDRFMEDDSGEYYCDICEKERYQLHPVYFCQECDGTFVAHIECALAEQVEEDQHLLE